MRDEYIRYMEESLESYERFLEEEYPANSRGRMITDAARFACFLAGKTILKHEKVFDRKGKRFRLPVRVNIF